MNKPLNERHPNELACSNPVIENHEIMEFHWMVSRLDDGHWQWKAAAILAHVF